MALYLIDFENVHDMGLEGVHVLNESDEVCIFYSSNSEHMSFDTHVNIMKTGATIKYIKLRRSAKNYLDFQLSTHLGYLIGSKAPGPYYIISKDTGYDSVVDYWKDHGVKITRQPAIVYNKNKSTGQRTTTNTPPAIVTVQQNMQVSLAEVKQIETTMSGTDKTVVSSESKAPAVQHTVAPGVLSSTDLTILEVPGTDSSEEDKKDVINMEEAALLFDFDEADGAKPKKKTSSRRRKTKAESSSANAAAKADNTKDEEKVTAAPESESAAENNVETPVSETTLTGLISADISEGTQDPAEEKVPSEEKPGNAEAEIPKEKAKKKTPARGRKKASAEKKNQAEASVPEKELPSEAKEDEEPKPASAVSSAAPDTLNKTAEASSDKTVPQLKADSLSEAYRKKVRTALRGKEIPSAYYSSIYKAILNSYDKLALNNLMVKTFGSSKGGIVYNLIKDIFTDYRNS